MSKEEEKEEIVMDIEYDKYCDAFAINKKKGVFALLFGQSIEDPPKMVARIWIDAEAMKMLSDFLQEQIKLYEKEHGKIK